MRLYVNCDKQTELVLLQVETLVRFHIFEVDYIELGYSLAGEFGKLCLGVQVG